MKNHLLVGVPLLLVGVGALLGGAGVLGQGHAILGTALVATGLFATSLSWRALVPPKEEKE
jgi:hypothetical protein